jgi:hypothetical protein
LLEFLSINRPGRRIRDDLFDVGDFAVDCFDGEGFVVDVAARERDSLRKRVVNCGGKSVFGVEMCMSGGSFAYAS